MFLFVGSVSAMSNSWMGDGYFTGNLQAENLTVWDLVVQSGSSITLAGAKFENEGTFTSVDTDFGVHEDEEPTAFFGVYAHNDSIWTHANIIMEAGVEESPSFFNIVKNSPIHPFSPNASAIINEGNHGTIVPYSKEITWYQYNNLTKDEYGNIEYLNGLQRLMMLNNTSLNLDAVDLIVNGSITADYFIGDGSELTDVPSIWTDYLGNIFFNSGNVGIGILDPSEKLEVAGRGDTKIVINSIDGNNVALRLIDGTEGDWTFQATEGDLRIYDIAGGSGEVIRFENATGNVGIGTNDPEHPLHVFTNPANGQVANFGRPSTSGTWVEINNSEGEFGIGTDNGELYIYDRVDTAYRMVINTLGYIGVGGKTVPTSPMHVYENTASIGTSAGLTIENAGTGDALAQFLITGTQRWAMGIDNSDDDNFKIAGSSGLDSDTYLTIERTTGDVGIGITAPVSTLHLYEDTSDTGTSVGLTVENAGTGDALVQFRLNNSGQRWIMGADNSDGDKFKIAKTSSLTNGALTIDTADQVGISNTAPSEALDVTGNIRSSAGIFNEHFSFTYDPNAVTTVYTQYIGTYDIDDGVVDIIINDVGNSHGASSSFQVNRRYGQNPRASGMDMGNYEIHYRRLDSNKYELFFVDNQGSSDNDIVYEVYVNIQEGLSSTTLSASDDVDINEAEYTLYQDRNGDVSIGGNVEIVGTTNLGTIPTSDPGVAGELWRVGLDLKISLG